MSTSSEISRLQTARNTIRDKLITFGLAESTDKLDDLADAIDSISYQGAITATVQEGDTYTIPAGYHNGSGTVSGVAGGGNYTLQSKGPITPTKNQQSITADNGYYGLSGVTIEAIPEAYQNVSSVTASASDVLANKIIVTSDGTITSGTMTNNGAVNKTLDATSGNQSYTVPAGYHNGSGTVAITLETKSTTPTTSSQDITPTSGKVLSKVTVDAIPAQYGDTTNDDAIAANLLYGKKAHTMASSAATQITGTMPNNGTVTQVLDATSGKQSYTIAQGYHSGSGAVSIVLETTSVTPTTSSQDITPTDGKVLSKVTVDAIPSAYQDVSNVDAVATDVLYGKIIVAADGTEITGSMMNNGAISAALTVSSASYTVPAGYHNGSGTVAITLEEKSATPSTSAQNITPSTGKVLSKVAIAAIPVIYGDVTGDDAVAANILSGKKAHTLSGSVATQITGSMTDNGAVSKTLDATSNNQSYTVPAGYHNGSGTVAITLETKSATPTTSSQDITPTSGKVLSKVTVAAIPAKYGDTTGDDGAAGDVLYGKKVHTISSGTATQITGSMTNNAAIAATIDGLTTTSYTVPAGYHNGSGTVSLTDDIETALAAI